MLEHDQPAVLAHRADADGGTVVAVHNLRPDPTDLRVRLDGVDGDAQLVDLLTDGTAPVDAELHLEGFAARWLRVVRPGDQLLV